MIFNGLPTPRIVLLQNTVEVADFVLLEIQGGSDVPPYLSASIDVLRHTLINSGRIAWKARGLWFEAQMTWKMVIGEELQKLNKLLDIRTYDECVFYPYSGALPAYSIPMTISGDTLELAYYLNIRHRNFALKLISSDRVASFPLDPA